MDSARRDGELVLRFDVPGVDPEKIDVTVDKGVLTVSATREEAKTEGENPIVRERRFGSFTRRVRLSDNLNAEAIEASNSEGVLEIRIPVLEEAKPRKITVARDRGQGAGQLRSREPKRERSDREQGPKRPEASKTPVGGGPQRRPTA